MDSEERLARIDAHLERGEQIMERHTVAFERLMEAFDRHERAFERHEQAFESFAAKQKQSERFLDGLMTRQEQAWLRTEATLIEVRNDVRDDIRALTKAVLQILDRLPPPQSA